MFRLRALLSFLTAATVVCSLNVTDIQGPSFTSPYAGQNVSVVGVVSAKGTSGFFLSGPPVEDIRVSNGLYVFSTTASVLAQVTVGDQISVNGLVSEYRSSTAPDDLLLTELTKPTNITVLSKNNTVTPVVLGKDRSPPTELFTSLDEGPDGFLSIPNNVSQIQTKNPELQPALYGLDFWESLEGQLVQINSPTTLDFENQYGEFWVYGDWPVTGKNKRGGLSINFGPNGIPDGNPEAILIDNPLDGTKNPVVPVGAKLSDIVGVVTYQFGFYYVIPLTAPTIISQPDFNVPASKITASKKNELTIGDYNVENMSPTSDHLPTVADHIVSKLNTPDIMFVQEIQDNSGETSDGVVSANVTLATLVAAIKEKSGVEYQFTNIDPVDGKDGGVPGGNIRQAYLYKPEKLTLVAGAPAGTAEEAVQVITKKSGYAGRTKTPHLSLNPGRIDPTNAAWTDSRKPLVAEWITSTGKTLFTINVHFASKGGSSSLEGNSRPPVNAPSDQRKAQVATVASFVQTILDVNKKANIAIAGDFNEFVQARAIFEPLHAIMTEVDEAAGIPELERYTYVFQQSTQQLDHLYISKAIVRAGKVSAEHVHVNTFSPTYAARISDHDPSVAKVTLA
ncbi:Endonuclease/exonuclease/phosphatase [Flagelloscypha sp. PMI_526]|nr:Endonuclease/exonuclease/phosphatase [Flagelloscypha sp. PMI_526]